MMSQLIHGWVSHHRVSFQNVKRGVLRASRSAWAEELFSLIHFSFFFDGRTSTPSQGIFQFHPLSNHRKDTKTSKKNILSSPPLKISEFLLEKSRKSRKIKKKRILWRTKNRENNEIITITGDYPDFISRGKIIRPIIKWHFLKCWD